MADRLLAWWSINKRDLPWRHTREPWPILVSEVMAQQTQVARVIPSWERFLARFPSAADAASSSVGDVVELWDGLGYNRRAVLLHRCATAIVERHGGEVPDDMGALLALPGIGPYTARAVLAFAFERDVAVVDTNVGRVLARVEGRMLGSSEVQARADAHVPPEAGWEWNQAILDFGAMVCTKRRPACGACPIRLDCAFVGEGIDPAVGSAGVSGAQSPFEGSDRQGRGRLVAALRTRSVPLSEVGNVVGWSDADRVERMVETLLDHGLIVRSGSSLGLS